MAFAVHKNKQEQDKAVWNEIDKWNNEPRIRIMKTHIPTFNGTAEEVEAYIDQIKRTAIALELPTGTEKDDTLNNAAAALNEPVYTYIFGNPGVAPAGYRIVNAGQGVNAGEAGTGNKHRDGLKVIPAALDNNPNITNFAGKEPIQPTGYCQRAKQVIDALVTKWKGSAEILWKNTPDHERPRTLEPYQFYYTDATGNEARAPQAIGFYEFIRRNWQGRSQESENMNKWYNLRYDERRYPGGVNQYNVDFTNTMMAAGLDLNNNGKFIIPQYIESFKAYDKVHEALQDFKDNIEATGREITLPELNGLARRKMLHYYPGGLGLTRINNYRSTRKGFGFAKLKNRQLNNIEEEQINNIGNEQGYAVYGKFSGGNPGNSRTGPFGGRIRAEVIKTDKQTNECFRCGKTGHWANECRTSKSQITCKNCGRTGHEKKECTIPTKSRMMNRNNRKEINLNKETTCYRCRGKGHMTDSCPTPSEEKQRTLTTGMKRTIQSRKCYKCEGNGHMAGDHMFGQ
jgi:cellular nucleic acid-binding protein